jgi:hypothetical protein
MYAAGMNLWPLPGRNKKKNTKNFNQDGISSEIQTGYLLNTNLASHHSASLLGQNI